MDEFDESNDEENASSSSESEEEQDTVTAPPIKKPSEKGKKVVESTVIKTTHDRQHAPSTSTSPPAMHFQIRDFYFRALGSLVVLSFSQLLSFSSVFPKPLSETLTRSSDGRNPVQLTVPC
jgi:hypothetical protein